METIYLCIIIFLFVLAVFDLIVGVSNDAVNFLNSAVGAKAASFKTILFIAGIGIFIGASLSNGMMDIARHGIYQPEHFYFAEIMCILLAVMLTDVLDNKHSSTFCVMPVSVAPYLRNRFQHLYRNSLL